MKIALLSAGRGHDWYQKSGICVGLITFFEYLFDKKWPYTRNFRGFDRHIRNPFDQKMTLYMGHIMIKISEMAVKIFYLSWILLGHFIKTYERVLNGKVMASTMSFSNVFIWFKTLEIWQVTFHGLARGT